MAGPTIIPHDSLPPPEPDTDLRLPIVRATVGPFASHPFGGTPGWLVFVSIVPLGVALGATFLATTMTVLALLSVVIA